MQDGTAQPRPLVPSPSVCSLILSFPPLTLAPMPAWCTQTQLIRQPILLPANAPVVCPQHFMPIAEVSGCLSFASNQRQPVHQGCRSPVNTASGFLGTSLTTGPKRAAMSDNIHFSWSQTDRPSGLCFTTPMSEEHEENTGPLVLFKAGFWL